MNLSAFIIVPVPAYSQCQTCPICNAQVTAAANYCNMCGAPMKPQIILKICSRCKSRMSVAANFCPECGQKQDK